jgi:hypothetical protein
VSPARISDYHNLVRRQRARETDSTSIAHLFIANDRASGSNIPQAA